MKNKTLLYILSYLFLILSYLLYIFVSIPSDLGSVNTIEYNFGNTMIYVVLPLIGALILTVLSYLIYFKFLPKKKNNLFIIPEFINLICVDVVIFIGLYFWINTGDHFFGAMIGSICSIILFLIGIIPIVFLCKKE